MHFITLFWKLLFAFVPPTGEMTLSDKMPTERAHYWPEAARSMGWGHTAVSSSLTLRLMIKKFTQY
jgi:hypothetical protein